MLKLGAHVEVFKRDESTGERMLVSTSRPCVVCERPLEGLLAPYNTSNGDALVHARCREGRKTVGF